MQLHIFTSPQDFRLKQKFILAPAEFLTQLGGKQIILIICKITEKFRSFVRPMTRLISLLSTVFQMTRHKSWVKTNDCRQVKRRKCKLTWIFYYIINHSRTWHEFLNKKLLSGNPSRSTRRGSSRFIFKNPARDFKYNPSSDVTCSRRGHSVNCIILWFIHP